MRRHTLDPRRPDKDKLATLPQLVPRLPRVRSHDMKLPALLFILLLVHQHVESRNTWLPESLFNSFANKTSMIRNYVRDKSESLKKFYVENVKGKLSSVLYTSEPDQMKVESRRKQQSDERVRKKFEAYLNSVESSDHKVFSMDTEQQKREERFMKYLETRSIKTNEIPSSEEPEKCNVDPLISMTTAQLIAIYGYLSETHTIITDDGYILTLHRIPHPKGDKDELTLKPRKTVLLHHGLLGSSADWIIPGPGKSLALILSDAGYDVWLANVRGNTYSRAHISRPVDSYAFWNFTFHEVSQHDLPAIIDYIMELKGWEVKINYIGHSMGTTILFALLSTKTQYNKILRAGFALAPVAYMTDIKSPIKLLAKFANNIEYLMKLLGVNEFLPQGPVLKWLAKLACEVNHYEEAICENSLFVLCGYDPQQFNKTLLPIILGHVPAGASTKTLIHYAQEIRADGRFQQFDYGSEGNLKQYGSLVPPEYPVHKITLPIALLSAENDWLASDIDVTNLYVQLNNPIEHYIVPLKTFNHIDFIWGIDAMNLVYRKLLQLLDEGANPTSSIAMRTHFFDDSSELNNLDEYKNL